MYTVWVQDETWLEEIKAYTFETDGNVIKQINDWWKAFKRANPRSRIINIHPTGEGVGAPGLNG